MAHLLTSDLLVTRISKGKIKPVYTALDAENLELARLLIGTFEQHVGKTYGELLAELEGYEDMDYRFIRGLSQLLERRAVIETDSLIDPTAAREAVFEACSGMALSAAEKKEALKKAAKKFAIFVPELEKALWADLEENQVIKSFFSLSPAALLRQYNLSLTQTLLFRAVDLDIWVKGDFQTILWKILRSGLMYTLEDIDEKDQKQLKSVHLHLDGPASLFRMSERYGTSFAKLLPVLLRSKLWSLKAGILYKGYQGKRVLEFTLDDSEEAFKPTAEVLEYPDTFLSGSQIGEKQEEYETKSTEKEAEAPETYIESETYDSKIEKMFSSLSLGSWKVKREPTILKAGKYAFVPDFVLQRDGMKVYLEIVGFWTPEYLKKKVEKLKDVEEPVILLIDRKLKCSEKDFPAQEVIFFDRKIPVTELMQVLRKYEGQKLSEDLSKTREMEIPLSGELVNLEKIAAEKEIMLDALKEVIADRLTKVRENMELETNAESEIFEGRLGDYVLLGNYMVHRHLLEKINLELEKPEALDTYADATRIFVGFRLDISLYYPVLEHLGYKVIWTGLSEEDARVRK